MSGFLFTAAYIPVNMCACHVLTRRNYEFVCTFDKQGNSNQTLALWSVVFFCLPKLESAEISDGSLDYKGGHFFE